MNVLVRYTYEIEIPTRPEREQVYREIARGVMLHVRSSEYILEAFENWIDPALNASISWYIPECNTPTF